MQIDEYLCKAKVCFLCVLIAEILESLEYA